MFQNNQLALKMHLSSTMCTSNRSVLLSQINKAFICLDWVNMCIHIAQGIWIYFFAKRFDTNVLQRIEVQMVLLEAYIG